MKKIRLYSCAVFFMALYALCCNEQFVAFMVKGWPNSNRPSFLRSDANAYGDLYGLSHIAGYKLKVNLKYQLDEFSSDSVAPMNLYVVGDSFLKRTFSTDSGQINWGSVCVRNFSWYGVSTSVVQRPAAGNTPNVLLIEMAERFVAPNLSQQGVQKYVSFYQTDADPLAEHSTEWTSITFVPKLMEQNISSVLFGYELFGPIKSLKAFVDNHVLFTRGSQVYECSEKQRLFLSNTVLTYKEECVFRPVSDGVISGYVNQINALRDKFLELGFDEVYISIIPNAVSVTPPTGLTYNNLIPRIQNHDSLKAPMIDVYERMISSTDREDMFWRSDTHWTKKGFSLWMEGFKQSLQQTGK